MAQWWEKAPLAAPEQAAPQQQNWWESAPLAEGEQSTYDQYVKPVVNVATGIVSDISGMVQGKQDERFKGLPNIRDGSGLIMDGAADSTAVSDKAYRDVYIEALKKEGRFVDTFDDKHGQSIIRFRDKDGSLKSAYTNSPGLDSHDVERGISAALPYMAAGGAVGRLASGAGSLANVALQGLAGAGTSVAQDIGAQAIGSRQSIDGTRALLGGVMGAGGELVGRALVPFIRRVRKNKSLVGDDGKLTARGRKLAQDEGVDPNLIDDEMARRLQNLTGEAADPTEALRKVQTDKFGIQTTKAQRTSDPQMLLIEKDIRAGTLGDRAKESMRNLDDGQTAAVKRAATEYDINSIPGVIAPSRATSDLGRDTLGEGVLRGRDAATARISALENQAWKGTENIAPRSGALDSLPDFVQKALGPRRVDDQLTPSAYGMARELDAYIKGKAGINPEAPEVLGQQSIRYIDEMRRRLMAMKDGASPGADSSAAKAIYKSYDDWMVDAAEKNLLTGSPGAAQAVLNARRTTAELRGVLAPRLNGKKTPAARILEKLQGAETGEEALKALLGSSGPKADLPAGAVKAVTHFKAAATQLGGKEGKAAWADVKLARWLSLVTGKNGEMLPNGTLITSINSAFKNQPSLMNALYSKKEQTLMRQFAQALKSATPKDPNPPGSGTAVRGLFPNLVKDQLQAASTRATFGSKGQRHKILLARIYRGLSKVLPQVLDGKNQFGSMAASRATSQSLTQKALPSAGGYAAAFAPSVSQDRTALFAEPRLRK